MGRALGIDLGARRIGVALTDPSRVLASPHTVVERGRDRGEDHRRLAALVEETGADVVVVGLPRSLDGGAGAAQQAVEAEIEELRAVLPVPVEVQDERFTTVLAHRSMQARGVRARDRRSTVDQEAAAVLLQSWVDGR